MRCAHCWIRCPSLYCFPAGLVLPAVVRDGVTCPPRLPVAAAVKSWRWRWEFAVLPIVGAADLQCLMLRDRNYVPYTITPHHVEARRECEQCEQMKIDNDNDDDDDDDDDGWW